MYVGAPHYSLGRRCLDLSFEIPALGKRRTIFPAPYIIYIYILYIYI